MRKQTHEIVVLKGYYYLLSLWGENIKGEPAEYFAKEALLMSLLEQNDMVNNLSLTDEQKQEPEISSLLISIKQQLLANKMLTEQKNNSNKSGEF